ncbi:MAG: zf-HC2 domain-containing protein [Planctomycetota bacterium]
MKCPEARQHLYPFLDDELDVPTNLDVLAHLHVCSRCADLFEEERQFNDSLRASQRSVTFAHDSRLRVLERFRRQAKPTPMRRLGSSMRGVAGIAAASVLLISLVFLAISLTSSSGLALSAAKIHERAIERHDDLRSWPIDSKTLEGYVRGRFEHASLQFLDATSLGVLGGRDCSQLEPGAVQVGLSMEGRPVSLYILSGAEYDLSEFEMRESGGRSVYVCPARRCAIVAWRCGDLIYALTGAVELEGALLSNVPSAH